MIDGNPILLLPLIAVVAHGATSGVDWVRIDGTDTNPLADWSACGPGEGYCMGAAEFSCVGHLDGRFSCMGSGAPGIKEHPIRKTIVRTFEMSRSAVTVAQYARCVHAGICAGPGTGKYCNFGVPGRERHPVNCVDQRQARDFASWAGARLPSDAEWEFAARSRGRNWWYPWGREKADCQHAVMAGCASEGTMPVCSKPMGRSEQGLCDLVGNVTEWTQAAYGVRGGNFLIRDPLYLRATISTGGLPGFRELPAGRVPLGDGAYAPVDQDDASFRWGLHGFRLARSPVDPRIEPR